MNSVATLDVKSAVSLEFRKRNNLAGYPTKLINQVIINRVVTVLT